MAEHEPRARRRDEAKLNPHERDDHDLIRLEEQEIRRERSQNRRLSEMLRFADLMAILMVLATLMSAYATWRTAQVTNAVFLIADRPFLGVQRAQFEAIDSPRPTVTVDFRNFGQIPAIDAIATVNALIDGKRVKPVAGEMASIDAGIVPPNVPYYLYAYLPTDAYQQVVGGKSNLQVQVRLMYKSPRLLHEYCYFERIVYDYRSETFRMAGGNDRCGSEVF